MTAIVSDTQQQTRKPNNKQQQQHTTTVNNSTLIHKKSYIFTSLALFNQLYMYSMYPSAVVGGSYVLYCVVECRLSPLWGSLYRYYNFLYIINIGYACIRISLLSRGYWKYQFTFRHILHICAIFFRSSMLKLSGFFPLEDFTAH